MKKYNILILSLLFIFLGAKNSVSAQTFINPYIGYGVTKLNYPLTPLEIYGRPITSEDIAEGLISKDDKLYSPRIYIGFSIIKFLDKYWSIDFQSDVSYQKYIRQDGGFVGRTGVYFWQFRNSIIPNLNIGDKWRIGLGFNFDYINSKHDHYTLIRKRVEFGGVFQVGYELNNHFNLHLNYRQGLKVSDLGPSIQIDPLQSLNLGLGYRFRIKNKKN